MRKPKFKYGDVIRFENKDAVDLHGQKAVVLSTDNNYNDPSYWGWFKYRLYFENGCRNQHIFTIFESLLTKIS